MDKNIGQQLNKAYEAYRQACMDRDSAIRELQQKTENYEQKIREQQEQLSHQQTIIDKLKSQLLLMNSSQDNGDIYVPLLENIETRKNKLTFDQPNEKMKSGIPRDKESKVRRQEVSASKKETSSRSFPLFHERGSIEKTFWELKEEFHRICRLAKAQKDHLSKLNIPDTATAEAQCSVPIQCTDTTDKQEALSKPQAKDDKNRGAPCTTSVTPRGLGGDEEETSFESLSKFNVKFPPMDSESAFLHSSPERHSALVPATSEAACQDTFNVELRENPRNFVKTGETLFKIPGTDPMQNPKTTDKTKPANLVNACVRTTLDRGLCLPPGDHNAFYINTFPLQDPSSAPFPSLDSPGKAIRGPQQSVWKPFPHEDSDLSVLNGTASELDIPRHCEFCQAVFPPSITARADFLRHLNTHFNGET